VGGGSLGDSVYGGGWSERDALFQIAYIDFLRPHIPIDIWGLLKRQPSLPPMYHGLSRGGYDSTVVYVRKLGDVGILKSYFLLLWTDLFTPSPGATRVMERSIREEFGGTGMEEHRKDLAGRLDHVLGKLDERLEGSPNDAFFSGGKETIRKAQGCIVGD